MEEWFMALNYILLMFHMKEQFFIYLAGRAGTGKSKLIEELNKNIPSVELLLLGTTNTSARGISGYTIHGFFHFPIDMDGLGDIKYEFNPMLRLVIIDEITIMNGRVLRCIDRALRKITGRNVPYGGCSIICVGDLKQLTIGKNQIYSAPDWYRFKRLELTVNYRQADDQEFSDRLTRWGDGILQPSDLPYLREKQICHQGLDRAMVAKKFLEFESRDKKNFIVCASDKAANAFNEAVILEKFGSGINVHKVARTIYQKMEKKAGTPPVFVDDEKDGFFMVAKQLPVMFTGKMKPTKGDAIKAGNFGVIVGFDYYDGQMDQITIMVNNKKLVFFRMDEKMDTQSEETRFSQKQSFHLVTSYALNAYKAQGMTLDNMIVDTSEGMLTDGMGYTTFSRVRTGANLHLTYLPRLQDHHSLSEWISADEVVKDILKEQPVIDLAVEEPELRERVRLQKLEQQAAQRKWREQQKKKRENMDNDENLQPLLDEICKDDDEFDKKDDPVVEKEELIIPNCVIPMVHEETVKTAVQEEEEDEELQAILREILGDEVIPNDDEERDEAVAAVMDEVYSAVADVVRFEH